MLKEMDNLPEPRGLTLDSVETVAGMWIGFKVRFCWLFANSQY